MNPPAGHATTRTRYTRSWDYDGGGRCRLPFRAFRRAASSALSNLQCVPANKVEIVASRRGLVGRFSSAHPFRNLAATIGPSELSYTSAYAKIITHRGFARGPPQILLVTR